MHKYKPGDIVILKKPESEVIELTRIVDCLTFAEQPFYTVVNHGDLPIPECVLERAQLIELEPDEKEEMGSLDEVEIEVVHKFNLGDIVKVNGYGNREFCIFSRITIVEESTEGNAADITYLVAPAGQKPVPLNTLEAFEEDIKLVRRGLKKDVPEFCPVPTIAGPPVTKTTREPQPHTKHLATERRILDTLEKNRKMIERAKAEIDDYLAIYSESDDGGYKCRIVRKIWRLSRFIQRIPTHAYEIDEEGCE